MIGDNIKRPTWKAAYLKSSWRKRSGSHHGTFMSGNTINTGRDMKLADGVNKALDEIRFIHE